MKRLLLIAIVLVGCVTLASAQSRTTGDDPSNYDFDKQQNLDKAQYAEPEEKAKHEAFTNKVIKAQQNDGYLQIPGFTYCGECPVMENKKNYQTALMNLRKSNLALYCQLVQDCPD